MIKLFLISFSYIVQHSSSAITVRFEQSCYGAENTEKNVSIAGSNANIVFG